MVGRRGLGREKGAARGSATGGRGKKEAGWAAVGWAAALHIPEENLTRRDKNEFGSRRLSRPRAYTLAPSIKTYLRREASCPLEVYNSTRASPTPSQRR